MKVSRSEFLRLSAAASAWVAAPGFARRLGGSSDAAVRPLPLTAVRLTGGPLKHAQDLDAAYLLSLDPDRMLAFYRVRAGWSRRRPATPDGTPTAAS